MKFEEPEIDKQPKIKRNQVMLFGNINKGKFKCYIYQCKTNLLDGKYWIIMDLNPDNVEFIRSENSKPDISDTQLLINTTINETGNLVADIDKEYQIGTNRKHGRYYAVLEIISELPEVYKMENDPPEIEKNQLLVEGNVWVDKYTGEIKFDPKKNRNDHRHHAIDAITIALTEQGYLQRLSTYNAQRKEKHRQKSDSTEKFPEPWNGFTSDVKKAVDSILVSYNKSNKTLTKNKKGFSVRGQLHKENVYGKRKSPNQEGGFHRRKKIIEITDNKLVGKIVDDSIREIIENHLRSNFNIDTSNSKGYKVPKDAFYKDGKWQINLPNKRGEPVPIKKVRLKEVIGNALQLKSNINQYVNPRNNHHILIYKDYEGNLQEDVVQFWTVVERKIQNREIYQLPEDGVSIITTLEINDMFLLGLTDEEFRTNENNYSFLSKYLFRVQKVSSSDYNLRYHLASTLDNKNEEVRIRSIGAWEKQTPIKVTVDNLGFIHIIS